MNTVSLWSCSAAKRAAHPTAGIVKSWRRCPQRRLGCVVAGKDRAGQLRFAELVFHALRGGDPNKKGEQRPLGSHSPVSPPALRLIPLGRLALSLHNVSRDNAANG